MNKLIICVTILFVWLSLSATNTITDFLNETDNANMSTEALGLQFTLINSGTAYSVSAGTATANEIVIPETYNFLPVTTIGARAFYVCSNLISIVIPEGVTSISNEAFRYCYALENVTLPNSLTSIGNHAFASCFSLNNIIILDNVRTIGSNAFLACRNFTTVVIPNSVTSIGANAFQACDILANVTIGSGVTNINSEMFAECPALSSLNVDANNSVYMSEGNCIIRSSNNYLVLGCQNSIIPNTVTHIGDHAFEDCKGLTDINIPNSVISIGNDAFFGCDNLSSVTIPESVNTIGSYAFGRCFSLSSINIPNSVTSIGEYAFFYCIGLTDFIIPESIYVISPNTFYWCTGLTNIAIPNSLTSIGESAFQYCYNLETIAIPASVISIRQNAFLRCYSLTVFTEHTSPPPGWLSDWNLLDGTWMPSLYLPVVYGSLDAGLSFTLINNGSAYEVSRGSSTESNIIIPTTYNGLPVTRIAVFAFYNSLTLTNITIPSGIEQIGAKAFVGCENLTSIHIPDSVIDIVTQVGYASFPFCSGLTSITVDPENPVYRSEGNCLIQRSNNAVILGCQNSVIPDGVSRIGDGAFQGCSNLTEITVPNSVTSIGAAAFQSCTSLTSFDMPNSVVSIGSWTFDECSNLSSVTLSNQLSVISWMAFDYCYSLQSIDIPDSVVMIESEAFNDNFSLVEVNIGNGVTEIEFYAFFGCKNLTNLTFGSSIQIIDDLAFSYCTGIRNLSVNPNNLYYYSEGNCIISRSTNTLVFGCNDSIIPAGVTSIGAKAFQNCEYLSNITFPESVTSIGSEAFTNCQDLKYVYIGSNVTNIGQYAFSNWSLVVFTEYPSRPAGWSGNWAGGNETGTKVVWGVTIDCVAPSNLVYQTHDNTINLAWTQPNGAYIPNFISYAIYRDGVSIVNTGVTNPSFVDVAVSAENHSYYVTAIYTTGESGPSNTLQVNSGSDIVSVVVTSLAGNYPNPFNPSTTIAFDMAHEGYVSIEVYNVKGQRIKEVISGRYKAGSHKVIWNGDDSAGQPVGSGVYFYRMTTAGYSSVQKMMLLK